MDIKPVFIAVSSLFILCCKNNSGKLSRGARPFILKISTANYGFLWFWIWWWSRYKLMLRWWELGPGVTLGDVIRWTGNVPGPGWGCDMVITSWAAGDMVITSCVGHHTVLQLHQTLGAAQDYQYLFIQRHNPCFPRNPRSKCELISMIYTSKLTLTPSVFG